MRLLFIKLVIFVLAVFITDWLLPGIAIKTPQAYLMVALAMAGINTFIKPIILFFSLPITLMTMGLFPLFLNTFLVLITAYLIDGFEIFGSGAYSPFQLFWAFLFGLLFAITHVVIEQMVKLWKE
jgi:putative membrane protein